MLIVVATKTCPSWTLPNSNLKGLECEPEDGPIFFALMSKVAISYVSVGDFEILTIITDYSYIYA